MIIDPSNLDNLDFNQDHQSQWHKYRAHYPEFAKPAGYTNRSTQQLALKKYRDLELAEDSKEYYHFHPAATAQMIRRHQQFGWGPLPPEVHRLHKKGISVHNLAAKAISQAYLELEENHSGLIPNHWQPADIAASPLRILFYHPGSSQQLASSHFDKAFSTLQIAESHLGLRIRDQVTGEMTVINRPSELGAFFLGLSWQNPNGYPDSILEPAEHEVIDAGQATKFFLPSPNVARWAIVFFANSHHGGTITNKSLTHV